jgi:hypothetical protein
VLEVAGENEGGEIAQAGGGERGDIEQACCRWPLASRDALVGHLVYEFRIRFHNPHGGILRHGRSGWVFARGTQSTLTRIGRSPKRHSRRSAE